MNRSRFDQFLVLASLLALLFVAGCDSPREERRELRRALFGVCDAYLDHNDPNTKTMLANLYGVCFQVPAEYWGWNPMYGGGQVPIDTAFLAAEWVDGELVPRKGPIGPENFEGNGIVITVYRMFANGGQPFGLSPYTIDFSLARDNYRALADTDLEGMGDAVAGYGARLNEDGRFASYLFALSDRSIQDPDGSQPVAVCSEPNFTCRASTRLTEEIDCTIRFSIHLISDWPEIREQTNALCKSAIKEIKLASRSGSVGE